MATMIAKDKGTINIRTGWDVRHNTAVAAAVHGGNVPFESPIARLLESWAEYAKAHKVRFESKIGHDYVLGPE